MFKPLGPQGQWSKEKGVSRLGKGIMWLEVSSSHNEMVSSVQPALTEQLLNAKPWARPKAKKIIP